MPTRRKMRCLYTATLSNICPMRTFCARNYAIDHLLEAVHINPDFLKAYLILGQLCKDADQTEDAMFVYRNALEHLPDAHILREELCDRSPFGSNSYQSRFSQSVFDSGSIM